MSINGDIVNTMNLPETMKIKPYQTLLCQFFLNKVLMCLKHFFMNFIFYTFFTTFIPACSALTPPFLSPFFDPCPLPYQFVMRNMDMGNKCSSDCFVVMEFNQKIHFLFKGVGFYLQHMSGMFYPTLYIGICYWPR